jgi:hypothetical protein
VRRKPSLLDGVVLAVLLNRESREGGFPQGATLAEIFQAVVQLSGRVSPISRASLNGVGERLRARTLLQVASAKAQKKGRGRPPQQVAITRLGQEELGALIPLARLIALASRWVESDGDLLHDREALDRLREKVQLVQSLARRDGRGTLRALRAEVKRREAEIKDREKMLVLELAKSRTSARVKLREGGSGS